MKRIFVDELVHYAIKAEYGSIAANERTQFGFGFADTHQMLKKIVAKGYCLTRGLAEVES